MVSYIDSSYLDSISIPNIMEEFLKIYTKILFDFEMNPTQMPSGINLSSMIPDTQTLSFPKIDHILAHAKHPELSYIYARPEF